MAKLEVSDAFEMRGRIMVLLAVVTVLVSTILWMGLKWLLVSLSDAVFVTKAQVVSASR